MAVREYNSIKGFPFEKLDQIRIVGSTSASADEPLTKKPISPYRKLPLAIQPGGKGVYIENSVTLREGYNFPLAGAEVEAGAITYQKIVHLGGNIVVAAYVDGGNSSKGTVIAGKVAKGGGVDWGTEQVFNDALTTDIGLIKTSSTTYAISYCDDGDTNDLLNIRMGTVNTTTLAITQGDEKGMTSGSGGDVLKASLTDICQPRPGVLFVAYALNDDVKGYGIAATFSGVVVASPGTAVEFDGANDGGSVSAISCCSHDVGDVTVVYQAGGDTNDPITACCGTVSTAAVIAFGAEVTMAGAAAAATSISCVSPITDLVVFTWIDSTFAHINSMSISGTTPSKQTELELTAATTLTPSLVELTNERFAVAIENDAHGSDILQVIVVTRDTYTFTKDSTHWAVHATSQQPVICQLDDPDNNAICLFYDDVGDSNKGKVIVGHWREDIIDVRSNAASVAFSIIITPSLSRKRKA